MIRRLALVWLVVVALAGAYLAVRLHEGLAFRTDLTALLPREERDPVLRRANDAVTRALSQRVVLLVGHADRERAREAARQLTDSLAGHVDIVTSGFDKAGLQDLGRLYFPYRRGLLGAGDRALLLDDKAGVVAERALARAFGFFGMSDARLLRQDPFLLLQGFFTDLPLPLSRLEPDDGLLSVREKDTTWVLVAGQLRGEPFALAVQDGLAATLDPAVRALDATHPGLEILRLGAVFYAKAGATQAMDESSTIGLASTVGIVLLVVVAFRALSAVWCSLLVIGAGVLTALSSCLWLFGELHVGALLFGVSLIGVAVDYCLQYCTEIFAPDPADPQRRLRRVFTGISLGMAMTVIGYLTLFLAPFPGLHQIAAFSAIGLLAAWTTVVLWLPLLDRAAPPRHGRRMIAATAAYLGLWENAAYRRARQLLLLGMCAIGGAGLLRLHADDDVRRMQSLNPGLAAQQARIQSLTGTAGASQFILVQAADDEAALRIEEELVDRLRPLVAQGALSGFQATAQYVPSIERQRQNRELLRGRLDPLLGAQMASLGLVQTPDRPDDSGPFLTPSDARAAGPVKALLGALLLEGPPGETTHVVLLSAPSRPDDIRAAIRDLPGARLVDPAGDFSALLGKYRVRAILLLALSAALMMPILLWRYGPKGAFRVMSAPALAVLLAPALRALTGAAFTFFDAMALVLVLSVGIDYAVFCAETDADRKAVTMLAVGLAACTALMSFGLLALSGVAAVHAFGATMLVGILLAFLLAPLGRPGQRART